MVANWWPTDDQYKKMVLVYSKELLATMLLDRLDMEEEPVNGLEGIWTVKGVFKFLHEPIRQEGKVKVKKDDE